MKPTPSLDRRGVQSIEDDEPQGSKVTPSLGSSPLNSSACQRNSDRSNIPPDTGSSQSPATVQELLRQTMKKVDVPVVATVNAKLEKVGTSKQGGSTDKVKVAAHRLGKGQDVLLTSSSAKLDVSWYSSVPRRQCAAY
jgi:hypothetical protein